MAQTQQPAEHLQVQPLTVLSEEERLFRASVREFAEAEIKPYVREMDDKQKIRPEIIQKCFELGLMGIEPGEEYGGSGGAFFMACLAIQERAPGDPSLPLQLHVNQHPPLTHSLHY